MTDEEFYGQTLYTLKTAEQYLLTLIAEYPGTLDIPLPDTFVMKCQSRIKSAESMEKKRTMAIDFWATLEHQLKYKKKISCEELIRRELK